MCRTPDEPMPGQRAVLLPARRQRMRSAEDDAHRQGAHERKPVASHREQFDLADRQIDRSLELDKNWKIG